MTIAAHCTTTQCTKEVAQAEYKRHSILLAVLECLIDWGITASRCDEGLGVRYYCRMWSEKTRYSYVTLGNNDCRIQCWEQAEQKVVWLLAGDNYNPDTVGRDTQKMCRFLHGKDN